MKLLLVTLTLVLAAAPSARAQDDGRDPGGLPDIAPREVEIRGRLDPSLPTLQRQPITGFNVPEVMYRLDRLPHTETYAEAELEQGPLRRPDLPDVTTLAGAPPIRGEFEASAGMYLSRIVRGHAALPVSSTASISGRVHYEGTDGFEPESSPGASTAYNDLEARLTGQTLVGTFALGADLEGSASRYSAFGAVPAGGGSELRPQPDLSVTDGGGSLWLRSHGQTRSDFHGSLQYGATQFETLADAFGGPAADEMRTEQRVSFTSGFQTPLPGGDLLAELKAGSSLLDEDQANVSGAEGINSGLNYFSAGGAYRFLHRRRFSITLGGTAMGYGLKYAGQGNTNEVYLSPTLGIELSPATGMRVYARNTPGIEAHSLASLLDANPFLVAEPQIEPSVRTIDAEAGASLFLGRMQLTGRTGFRSMPNYLYFELESDPRQAGGYNNLIAARYGEARIGYIGGDVSLSFPGGFQATLGGTLRDGVLDDPDSEIPYFGPLTGFGSLSVPFDRRRGLAQLVGTYESARPVDREETRTTGDFFDLDAMLSYDVTRWIGVVMRVQNISANRLERWDWYPQTPLTVMAGVQIEW